VMHLEELLVEARELPSLNRNKRKPHDPRQQSISLPNYLRGGRPGGAPEGPAPGGPPGGLLGGPSLMVLVDTSKICAQLSARTSRTSS
jgi:hypothetical protein